MFIHLPAKYKYKEVRCFLLNLCFISTIPSLSSFTLLQQLNSITANSPFTSVCSIPSHVPWIPLAYQPNDLPIIDFFVQGTDNSKTDLNKDASTSKIWFSASKCDLDTFLEENKPLSLGEHTYFIQYDTGSCEKGPARNKSFRNEKGVSVADKNLNKREQIRLDSPINHKCIFIWTHGSSKTQKAHFSSILGFCSFHIETISRRKSWRIVRR